MPDRRRRRTGAVRNEGRIRAASLAKRIGNGLHAARSALRLSQDRAAGRAGIGQSSWSRIERGITAATTLETLAACAAAVECQLAAFVEARPGADLPHDIEHARRQALLIGLVSSGGWTARPEAPIDPDARRSRSIDLHVVRESGLEQAVIEIVDLVTDVGGEIRNLTDKVAAVRRIAPPGAVVTGLLLLRSTRRNRSTILALRDLFSARFRGSSRQFVRALTDPAIKLPREDAIAWSSVDGSRLFPMAGSQTDPRKG